MQKIIIFFIVFVLFVLQITIVPRFQIFGAIPSILFAALLAFVLVSGNKLILIYALIAGLLLDFFSSAGFGIYSFGFVIVIWLAEFVGKIIFRVTSLSGQIALAAGGALSYSFISVIVIKIFQWLGGQPPIALWPSLIRIYLVEFILNFVFTLIFLFIIKKLHGLRARI